MPTMTSKMPLLVLSLLAFSMLSGVLFVLPVKAATQNGTTPGPDGIAVTTLPTTTSDDADYATTCPGGLSGCSGLGSATSSWGETIFSVTATTTVSITITDCCYEGDYYALYATTDPTGLTGWTLVGTTDQVDTGSELVAPTFDAAWTGTGTQYSSTTFDIPQSGTVLYAVRDVLFDTMVTLLGSSCGGASVVTGGCSATGISASPSWSPAGYEISFADAGTSGCLVSGATSWPTVTFTDSSTADVSVTGGVLSAAGVCPSMNIEDTFTTVPSEASSPAPVTSPNYYDLSITGLSAGTATLCITGSLVTSTTTMMYWNGNMWVSASSITVVGDEICGQIPVTALDTPSTPVVIGTGTTTASVPQFGSPAIAIAALGLVAIAILSRKLKPSITTMQ